jgi:hypothetical protein
MTENEAMKIRATEAATGLAFAPFKKAQSNKFIYPHIFSLNFKKNFFLGHWSQTVPIGGGGGFK